MLGISPTASPPVERPSSDRMVSHAVDPDVDA